MTVRQRIEARITEASPENAKLMTDILEETLVEGAIRKVGAALNMGDDEIEAHVHYWRSGVKGPAQIRKPEDIIRIGEVATTAKELLASKSISARQVDIILRISRKSMGL